MPLLWQQNATLFTANALSKSAVYFQSKAKSGPHSGEASSLKEIKGNVLDRVRKVGRESGSL
jgi:hypothetical protein